MFGKVVCRVAHVCICGPHKMHFPSPLAGLLIMAGWKCRSEKWQPPKQRVPIPPHTSKAPPPQAFITLQLLASSPLLMASLLQPMSLLSAIFPNIQSSPQPPTPTQFLSLLPNSLRTYSTPSSLCACGNLKLFTLCAQKWAMWLFVYIYFEAASWVETVIKLSVFTHCTIPHPSPIWISFDFFFSVLSFW